MAESREEVDRETPPLSQGALKDSPGSSQIHLAATKAGCLIPDTSPSSGPGAGGGGKEAELVTVISPDNHGFSRILPGDEIWAKD